jgi:uncharacterized protein
MAAITDTTGDPAVRHRSSHSPMISHGPPSPVLQTKVDSSSTRPMGLLMDQAKGPACEGVAITHHEHPNVTVVREGFAAVQRGDMAWMDQHLADDVVWHVGGNSKWAGAYQGKQKVLEYFARQAQSTAGPPSVDIHDILGDNDHVVVLGTASATAGRFQRRVEVHQIFHIRDGRRPRSGGCRERRRGGSVPGRPLWRDNQRYSGAVVRFSFSNYQHCSPADAICRRSLGTWSSSEEHRAVAAGARRRVMDEVAWNSRMNRLHKHFHAMILRLHILI